jgi:hypothetical protein
MTERARYWSDLVAAWSQSGVSQAEFCRRRDVKLVTFVWWKRQLQRVPGGVADVPKRRGRPAKAASPRFVEVRLPGTSSFPAYEVVLARGRSIRVPSQFDSRILSQLITAVESC